MKKYILLIIPVLVYIVVDLFFPSREKTYSDSDRLSNLEKAREAKKSKSILRDFEESNTNDTIEKKVNEG